MYLSHLVAQPLYLVSFWVTKCTCTLEIRLEELEFRFRDKDLESFIETVSNLDLSECQCISSIKKILITISLFHLLISYT